ncbi:MAG: DUF4845 domain-containing protein [Rhodocyclaceae bacterium]|nr:DUF4845 domain-containing protein [Rhodocyclaceae bacterium]
MKHQRGLTLISLVVVGVLLALVAVVGIKVAPDVIEYFTIVKDVKATAQDPTLRGATVTDIRKAFQRRAQIDGISAITENDLDIGKEGSEIVISFAYSKKVPLYGPVSLLLDFEGSSSGSAGK